MIHVVLLTSTRLDETYENAAYFVCSPLNMKFDNVMVQVAQYSLELIHCR